MGKSRRCRGHAEGGRGRKKRGTTGDFQEKPPACKIEPRLLHSLEAEHLNDLPDLDVWPHFAGRPSHFRKNASTSALNSAWNATRSKPGASTQSSGRSLTSAGGHRPKAKWPAFGTT